MLSLLLYHFPRINKKGSAYPALPQRMVNHCYLKVYCDGRLVDKANIIKKRCS